jgi:undecaprenyl-diphosphatase
VPTRKSLLGIAAAATVLFLLLARWVLAGGSMPADLWIRGAVHSRATPILTGTMLFITMLGSQLVLLPVGGALVSIYAFARRWRQAMLLGVGSLGAQLLSSQLKAAFHRPRPEVFFGLTPAENFSFPSGHAFVGTVFYGLSAAILIAEKGHSRVWATATVPMALAIGFSRVYLGYHCPTDVLGGWLCAVAWLALTGALINSRRQRHEQRR